MGSEVREAWETGHPGEISSTEAAVAAVGILAVAVVD